MRGLLIITQKVDSTDSNLGFFTRWIEEFAKRCEKVVVICLEKGDCSQPENVRVFSLGKEELRIQDKGLRILSRLRYVLRFLRYIAAERKNYDGVFIHMNPEYILAGWFLWFLMGKRTVLWYVHKEVSWRLWLAEKFVDKIFTASKESCRLRSKKVEVVGHGIDVDTLNEWRTRIEKHPARSAGFRSGPQGLTPCGAALNLSLLTVGRISPVKDLRVLILGFLKLKKRIPETTFSIVGEPITEEDRAYLQELRRISPEARFIGGVSHTELPRFLGDATVFVHASRTGSMDKAVLEALAAWLPVFTSSDAFNGDIPGITKFEADNPADLAGKIGRAFASGKMVVSEAGQTFVRERHSLSRLIQKILSFYAQR